jgi:hypothetical protein
MKMSILLIESYDKMMKRFENPCQDVSVPEMNILESVSALETCKFSLHQWRQLGMYDTIYEVFILLECFKHLMPFDRYRIWLVKVECLEFKLSGTTRSTPLTEVLFDDLIERAKRGLF